MSWSPPDEPAALALAAVLREHGHAPRVRGREVCVGAERGRLARVYCYAGDYVVFAVHLDEAAPPSVAMGDTRAVNDVVRAVEAWCRGLTVAEVSVVAPFVERGPRSFDALVAQLSDGVVVESRGSRRMSLTGRKGRTCGVEVRDSGLTCTLVLALEVVALVSVETDVAPAIRAWLIESVTCEELRARFAGLEILQTSHYFWRCLVEGTHDPQSDERGVLRSLVAALAAHPVANEFFPFTSHGRLSFSACSDYPWVSRGLPVVSPRPNGEFQVDMLEWGPPSDLDGGRVDASPRSLRSVDEVVEAVVDVLSRYPIRPFVGSARDLDD